MNVGSYVSWMVCGLIVGLVARLVVPGRVNLGLPLAAALGIVGALAGGFAYVFFLGALHEPFSLSGNAWHGWVVAILGAVVLLWVYVAVGRRSWSH